MPAREGSPSARTSRSWLLAIAALLLVYALTAASSVRQESITFDELAHLTGGVTAWLTSDYRLFPQNPQLPQRWAALPLVIGGVRPPPLDQTAWWSSDLEAIGHQLLYDSRNDHDVLLWRARLAMIPVGMLLGWTCYAWSRALFGTVAGVVALFACVFSPSIIAHGPLATSDLSAALTFTVCLAALWNALHRVTAVRLLSSALAAGLLFITKMSALLMIPVALVLTVSRVVQGRPMRWFGDRVRGSDRRGLATRCAIVLAAHIVGVVIVIWASYGFRYTTFSEAVPGRDQMFRGDTIDTLTSGTALGRVITLAQRARVLPEPYLYGIAHVVNRSGRLPGFLNGQHSINGWWYFFPYCWLVKTPLSLFALLAIGGVFSWPFARSTRQRLRARRVVYRLAPLLVFLAIYWIAALASGLNLGERHLLPIYPAVFILVGGAAVLVSRRGPFAAIAVCLLLLSLGIDSVRIGPHYLAYFNAVAGGPALGYHHLVDSSLDWGQDLPGLKQWIDRTQRRSAARERVYLSYFGSGDPAHYDIDAMQVFSYQDWRRDRPMYELRGGIYCISATMLQSVYTRAPGPWATAYEEAYQRLRPEFEGAAGAISAATRERAAAFDQLRIARLFSFLRKRDPDDQVGYSILIFRLSDEDVRRALDGPPIELVPRPQIKGLVFQ